MVTSYTHCFASGDCIVFSAGTTSLCYLHVKGRASDFFASSAFATGFGVGIGEELFESYLEEMIRMTVHYA